MPSANTSVAVRPNWTPSDALRRDASEHASALARVWPRPHAPYFAADRPRRRLVALLAARATTPEAAAAMADPLERWSARRLLAAYLPDAPHGLWEALKRIDGDGPWSVADYGRLLGLLAAEGDGAKALRHAPALTRAAVGALAELPPPLRRLKIVALLGGAREAALVARAFEEVCPGGCALEAARLADQLERAGSRERVFSVLIDAIADRRARAWSNVPGAAWLRPILGPKAMSAAAVRYENCLRARIPAEALGRAAFFEVLEPECGVIEIVRMADGGWRLGEMRGIANQDLSRATLDRVAQHLTRHGVRPWGAARTLVEQLASAIGWR